MEMNNIEEILKTIGAEDIPADVQRIAEQTSIDFDKTLTKSMAVFKMVISASVCRNILAAVTIAIFNSHTITTNAANG